MRVKDSNTPRTVVTIIEDPDEYVTQVKLETTNAQEINIKNLPKGSNFHHNNRSYFIYDIKNDGETFYLFCWDSEEPEIWKSSEFGMDVLMVEPLIAELILTRQ